MKKVTLFFLLALFVNLLNAQTIVWSSDSEDYATYSVIDMDGDGNFWGVYAGGGESLGFSSGAVFFSESYYFGPPGPDAPLDPDNLLFTPASAITIPGTATTITFKLKVAAIDVGFPAEKFAVYVYDEAIGPDADIENDVKIFETTLAVGGDGTATDISAAIPLSFAGKTIGIIVRHYDSFDQNQLLIDDFEVSYEEALSINDNELPHISVYPNPTKDIIKIDTYLTIDAVTIINQLGQNVMQLKNDQIINNEVNLSILSKGLYFMNINSEDKSQSIKIIKE
jgi:hypothetical protein